MRHSTTQGLLLAACLFSLAAQAEIYQSKDAEGNPVYTDMPTENSQKVDLPPSNIADSVEPAPATPSAAESAPAPETGTDKEPAQVIYVPNKRNEELERELAKDRPAEVLNADPRVEVDSDGNRSLTD